MTEHAPITVEDLDRMKVVAEMRLSHAMDVSNEAVMEIERRQLAVIALARRGLETPDAH